MQNSKHDEGGLKLKAQICEVLFVSQDFRRHFTLKTRLREQKLLTFKCFFVLYCMPLYIYLASHTGLFRGARLSSFVRRDERRAPLKTPAWEANIYYMPVAFDFSHQGHGLVTLYDPLYVRFLCSDWSKLDR